jgi:agmatine/peptidylarginine deiminase
MKPSEQSGNRLPAEWEPQLGVLLTWPHEQTDWHKILPQAEAIFIEIVRRIASCEQLFIACNSINQQHIQ